MSPTSSENIDGSAELTFTRDPNNPGCVTVEAFTFDDEGTWTEPLGSFCVRDLLIALHALTLTPTTPISVTATKRPAYRAVSPFFRRKDQ